MSKQPQVKNRAAAPIQISAEQLIREAKERQLEDIPKAPRQFITDTEELRDHRLRKRKEYEDSIRRQRQHIGTWVKYALWEAQQHEFERMRSVFERAIDVDYRSHSLWLKYAETEMKHKFINHARNVWDRAVTLHPRVDQFWYKYTYMEEMVSNIEGARQIFERWVKWEPDDHGWYAYIKFELRQGEISRARGIFERYIAVHPTVRAYLKYARFEEKQHERGLARQVFERSLLELADEQKAPNLYVQFARFEERCKEFERARVIFQYALEQDEAPELYQEFIAFEKKHGDREGIESVIAERRRVQYEKQVTEDRYNYDAWFDYIRLEEAEGDLEKIRDIYERAIANVPPATDKRYWRRYIYLWINYALFEELQANDTARTREVYKASLELLRPLPFTFGKLWLLWAQFEIRQRDVTAARKILGRALGTRPKENIFKGYIELELQLGEIDRARKIYEKYLETMPYNCNAWISFATLEQRCEEVDRARAIYELAITQPELDMPELLWKSYIDFEINEGEQQRARELYERLLERTTHVKVWMSYAHFEVSAGEGIESAISIYRRGYDNMKRQGLSEERVMILEAWYAAERQAGTATVAEVEAKMPRKIKKKRMATSETGEELGWEEYYDYLFPDDEKKVGGLKILEMAHKWKTQTPAAAAPVAEDDIESASKRHRSEDA